MRKLLLTFATLSVTFLTACINVPLPPDKTSQPSNTGDNNYRVTGPAQFDDNTSHELSMKKVPDVDLLHPHFYPDGSTEARITPTNRALARARGRLDINDNPSGWPRYNPKVDVDYPSGIHYHGYFYNRSHLIADSLGGLPESNNLIVGTRFQNVGDNHTAGGMGYPETLTRDFLDRQLDNQPLQPQTTDFLRQLSQHTKKPIPRTVDVPTQPTCDIAYKVTPIVYPKDTIPRQVDVDILSCDKSINQHIEISNTMPGFNIDYRTGEVSTTDVR